MPQMAPISWLILFILFSLTFIMFNVLNYYIFLYQSPSNSEEILNKAPKSMIWKW